MSEQQEPERRYALDVKVAVLEQKIDDVKSELDDIKSTVARKVDLDSLKVDFAVHKSTEEKKWDAIVAQLTDIKSSIGNQKSFIGGITFVLGGLFAIISLFKDQLLGLFK